MCYNEMIALGNNTKSFEITKKLFHYCKLISKRLIKSIKTSIITYNKKIKTSRKKKNLYDELLTVKKKSDEEVLMMKLNDDADKYIKQTAQDGLSVEEVILLVAKGQHFK